MADRTYVVRVVGESSALQAAAAAAGASFESLGKKASDFAKTASSAGQAAAKGFDAQGAAAAAASKHVEGFSFATSGAKRELLVLAHELSQGNFSRFGGSLLVLGERTGAAALLFSGLGVAALAAVGAVGGYVAAIVKGEIEQSQFNKSLVLTGNFAAQTNDTFVALSRSIAVGSGQTIGNAREIAQALVSAGNVGPRLIGPLGTAIASFSRLTGESAEKATTALVKLAEEPTKAAVELNKSLNFLNVAQYEQIRALELAGDKEGAALVATKALTDHFNGPHGESIKKTTGLYDSLKEGLSGVLERMKAIGREETSEDRLTRLYALQEKLRQGDNGAAGSNNFSRRGANFGGQTQGADVRASAAANTQQQITDELQAEAGRKRQAYYQAQADASNKAQIAAAEYIDKIKEESKSQDLATAKLKEYRAQVELLKGTSREVSPKEQATEEAAIRKKYDPVDTRAAKQLDNRFQERSVALQQEGARLDAELQSWTLYGRAVDKARLAVLNLEIAQGELKGLSPDKIAQLQAKAAGDDAKDKAIDQAKVNAEVSKSIEVLRSEANAHAQNSRETEIARRIAEMEAKGIKVGTQAYIDNAGEIRKWVDVKYDGILAQKLAAEGLANDAEVAKLDAESAALGESTLQRQKNVAVAKLQAEAERDLVANPGPARADPRRPHRENRQAHRGDAAELRQEPLIRDRRKVGIPEVLGRRLQRWRVRRAICRWQPGQAHRRPGHLRRNRQSPLPRPLRLHGRRVPEAAHPYADRLGGCLGRRRWRVAVESRQPGGQLFQRRYQLRNRLQHERR